MKWFESMYNCNSELAKEHRNAYNKSIEEKRCVKVQARHYYYKGFEIKKSEYTSFWIFEDYEGEQYSADSKKECIETIDRLLEVAAKPPIKKG